VSEGGREGGRDGKKSLAPNLGSFSGPGSGRSNDERAEKCFLRFPLRDRRRKRLLCGQPAQKFCCLDCTYPGDVPKRLHGHWHMRSAGRRRDESASLTRAETGACPCKGGRRRQAMVDSGMAVGLGSSDQQQMAACRCKLAYWSSAALSPFRGGLRAFIGMSETVTK